MLWIICCFPAFLFFFKQWVHLVVNRLQDQVLQNRMKLCHPDVKPSPAPGHGIVYVLLYFYCMNISDFLFSQIDDDCPLFFSFFWQKCMP